MSESLYEVTAPAFAGALTSLAAILSKSAGIADVAELRLAPDMLPFSVQVQFSCFHAVMGTSRLRGIEPEKFEKLPLDTAALRALLTRTAENLAALRAAEFAGAAERRIVIALQEGMVLRATGAEFTANWLLPNFYFHLVTAYGILRHAGAAIGKADYLGHLAPLIHAS